MPQMPERPRMPDEPPPKSSSLATIVVMSSLGLFVLVCLVLLMVVFNGAIPVIAGIVLFCAFHYFVWGWWLSKLIRQEDADGDAGKK